ncbi:t-SNARE [Umbelopsis sp. PMI_123]|nr:t-SNARE [Umbelopsis sp. PMI_123]
MNNNSRYTISRDRMAELRDNGTRSPRDNVYDEDEFGPPRVPTGYRSQSPRGYRDNYDDDRYNSPAPDNRYAPSRTQQQRGGYNDEYELRQTNGGASNTAAGDIYSMPGYLAEVDDIEHLIQELNQNISTINDLHGRALMNETQTGKSSTELDALINQTNKLNLSIKTRIKALEASNAGLPSNSDANIRRSQVAKLKKNFMDSIVRYQDVERTYQQKYRQRMERQIKIVKPNATQDEIDDIIDADDQSPIFAQSLMQQQRSGQARAVLAEVQNRHDDMKKIEKTIIELQQLFMDMQLLVEQQGEHLNTIVENADTTVGELERGNKHVDSAIKKARAVRAKKWGCFVLTIILAVVIAILVWWFAFNHKGCCGNP